MGNPPTANILSTTIVAGGQSMSDPYAVERRALVEAVTQSPGHLSAEIRSAIVDRTRGRGTATEIAEALVGLVDRVANDAPGITDADVDGVKAAGLDEEAVFEAIVAAALGASLARLEAVDVLLVGGL